MKEKKKNSSKLKTLKTAVTAAAFCLLHSMQVSASEPPLVTGTRKLIADATKILTGFGAGVTIIVALIFLFRQQTCSEEERPKYKKAAISTIVIGVIITTISGVVTFIFSYYA